MATKPSHYLVISTLEKKMRKKFYIILLSILKSIFLSILKFLRSTDALNYKEKSEKRSRCVNTKNLLSISM
jgi:hypothetical protein